jgi:DNA-binding NtrC family response regulator
MAHVGTDIDGDHQNLALGLSPERPRGPVSRGRMLLVDDERLIRELFAEYLQENGFECECAGSGEEAIERLEQGEFALLITDLSMPGISGLDLMKYAAENHPSMAVILSTGVYDLQMSGHSFELGAYHSISKPFDLETGLRKVLDSLRRREQQESKPNAADR